MLISTTSPLANRPTTRSGCDERSVLDEEINRLPEKYRAPIVLCYLQGHTCEEAAELLGRPRETVKSTFNERQGATEVQAYPPWVVAVGGLAADEFVRQRIVGCGADNACPYHGRGRLGVRRRANSQRPRVEFCCGYYTRSLARHVHHEIESSSVSLDCRHPGHGSWVGCAGVVGRFP